MHSTEHISPLPHNQTDVLVIGGGLAGLAYSILMAKAGHKVVLCEKEHYPFHRVCGEYISLESWNFLESLGLPLGSMNLPVIKKLLVSAPGGNALTQELPLGGFGISRYTLDHALVQLARQAGVEVREGTKVNEVDFNHELFTINARKESWQAKLVAGSFGKRSNLDIKWKRDFAMRKPNRLNNYIGVKYHVKARLPADQIALHNFRDGYCGISQIEEGKYCMCYLTTAANLQASDNSIEKMETTILASNPHLAAIFSQITKLYETPVTISQISFDKKNQVQDHIILLGDAAGMITPLCGNGMSMALHAAKIAAAQSSAYLTGNCTRAEMETAYTRQWKQLFATRLRTGRWIQGFFGSPLLSNLLVGLLKPFPFLLKKLIRSTHGKPF